MFKLWCSDLIHGINRSSMITLTTMYVGPRSVLSSWCGPMLVQYTYLSINKFLFFAMPKIFLFFRAMQQTVVYPPKFTSNLQENVCTGRHIYALSCRQFEYPVSDIVLLRTQIWILIEFSGRTEKTLLEKEVSVAFHLINFLFLQLISTHQLRSSSKNNLFVHVTKGTTILDLGRAIVGHAQELIQEGLCYIPLIFYLGDLLDSD